jgi:purine-binding chemotaxis protein CheW
MDIANKPTANEHEEFDQATVPIDQLSDEDERDGAQNMNRRVLVFFLQSVAFGLPVSQVREIVTYQPVTPVPNAKSLAPGLVNVRGAILPLYDLRKRLGLPEPDTDLPSDSARMIVFDAIVADQPIRLVFCADAVDSVVELNAETFSELPGLCTNLPPNCIEGVARDDERLIIRLYPKETFVASLDDPSPQLQRRLS